MRRTLLVVGLAIALCAGTLRAHHGYPGFDPTPVTVEAQIVSAQIGAPHILIHLRADDGRQYLVVWVAPFKLARQGVQTADLGERLKAGVRLTVAGRAKRGNTVTELLPDQIEHPVHGVLWSRTRS
jgi:hypothetical protein